MREEQAGGRKMDHEAEERALRKSLSALTARARAIRLELEGYQREITRSAGGKGTLLSAAFTEVLGGGSRAGSLRRLEEEANALLRALSASAGDGSGGGGAAGRRDHGRGWSEHAAWR